VLAAVGLSIRDLFDEPRARTRGQSANGIVEVDGRGGTGKAGTSARRAPKADGNGAKTSTATSPAADDSSLAAAKAKAEERHELVCRYIYHDADGAPAGRVSRFRILDRETGQPLLTENGASRKTFRQERHDGARWRPGGFGPLLYRLPEVTQAVAAGEPVYLVEGERDADTAAEQYGVTGTTAAQGAGKVTGQHAEQLRGARVVLVADDDLPGYRHAARVAELLDGIAASVECYAPAAGKDLTDHAEAGGGLAELIPINPHGKVDQFAPPPPDGPDDTGNDSDDQPAGDPEFPVPMSSGRWAYSTGDGTDGYQRGLYRQESAAAGGEWVWQAPLPHVLERLSQRDGDGRRRSMCYRLATRPLASADEVAVISDEDVKTGLWAERLDVDLSADQRIVQAVCAAIRNTARLHAEHAEMVPRWHAGELTLPATDVGPAGYGVLTPDEQAAREAWGEIAAMAIRAPKLALTLGASLGAAFVSPLGLQPFLFYLVGRAQHGKSTALQAAAAVWGEPASVVDIWNMSGQAPLQYFAELACVPAFLDERGSGGLSPEKTQALILSLTEGAKRRMGTKTGKATSTGGWRSGLFATGNASILGQITDEAIAARVLEIPAPITGSAADARRLKSELLPAAAGWVQHWQRHAGMHITGFADAITDALADLDLPDGGVARTLGGHYALALAGTARLEELLGVPGLRAAALTGAREILQWALAELDERGIAPAERVYHAATQAWAARPAAYPSRASYKAYLDGTPGPDGAPVMLPREIEGIDLTADPTTDADFAVLTTVLPTLCTDAGMTEAPTTGLRDLALPADGRLVPGHESGRLRNRLSFGRTHPKLKVYAFRLTDDDGENGTGQAAPSGSTDTTDKPDAADTSVTTQAPGTPPTPGTPPDEPVTSGNAATGTEGVCPGVPDGYTTTGHTLDKPVTSENEFGQETKQGGVPGVPGNADPPHKACHVSQDNPASSTGHTGHGQAPDAATTITTGTAGPVWLTGTHAACRICGNTAPSTDRTGPVHAYCAMHPDRALRPVEPAAERAAEHHTERAEPAVRAEGVCPVCGGRSTFYDQRNGTWRHVTCTREHAKAFGTPYPPRATPDMADGEDTTAAVETDTSNTGDTQSALDELAAEASATTGPSDAREASETSDGGIDPDQMMLGDPAPNTAEHADAESTEIAETTVEPEEPAEPDSTTQQTARNSTGLTLLDPIPTSGPRPDPPEPYRAACAVLDPSGIYLPDGTRYQLPDIASAVDVLALGEALNLGHPAGPGQVVLTDAMCEHLGLVAEPDAGKSGDEARGQITDRLAGLDGAFLAPARTAGWEAPSLRVETRARRGKRVLDVVLAPYEHLWARGREDSHPMGTLPDELSQEQYAAESARLMGYLAQLLGGPWRSSTVEAGWDVYTRAQKARSRHRGHVLTQPARLPELTGGTDPDGLTPAIAWPHVPSEAWTPSEDELDRARWIVRLDRRMAWLASAARTELGYLTDREPEMAHHSGAGEVAELLGHGKLPAGLWRVMLPAATPGMPPVHGAQSYGRARLLWVTTPTVETLLADDDPTASLIGAGCTVDELLHGEDGAPAAVEAWTFPAQGRLLGAPFSDTLRDARYQAAAHRDQTTDDLLKRVYAGCLQTSQNTSRKVIDGPRGWHHQASWLATVKAAHYQRQHHLLVQAAYGGHRPLGVEIDETAFLTTDDPEQFRLGNQQTDTPDGDVRMGQYRVKGAVELSDELRQAIRNGTSVFHLPEHNDGQEK
jgi:hypothetical protein